MRVGVHNDAIGRGQAPLAERKGFSIHPQYRRVSIGVLDLEWKFVQFVFQREKVNFQERRGLRGNIPNGVHDSHNRRVEIFLLELVQRQRFHFVRDTHTADVDELDPLQRGERGTQTQWHGQQPHKTALLGVHHQQKVRDVGDGRRHQGSSLPGARVGRGCRRTRGSMR